MSVIWLTNEWSEWLDCHENGGSVHEKSMTYERSLFSCYLCAGGP